jgi:L-seryl-tRNA(Ser) seleniumtransferase
MRLGTSWNRRAFLGIIAAVTSSTMAPCKLFAAKRSSKATGFGSTGNPYEELSVTTIINCQGTMTMLGGSVIRPELEAVMADAGMHFVNIPELEVAAGKRITAMLKLPEGYDAIVTSGAAARPCSQDCLEYSPAATRSSFSNYPISPG